MKKKVLFIFLSLLVLSLLFVSAQNETQTDAATKGYACLESRVKDQCSSLSTEEKIFSVLAVGKCKTELNSDSVGNACWPKPESSCKIKTTAQAVLALGSGTKNAEDWLLSKTMSFTGMEWYLQVESNSNVSCTATYLGSPYTFTVTDKVIDGDAGSCLSVSDNYWFIISSTCYGTELKLSCDKSFSTNLFYKKLNSNTFYVSGATHSAAGAGSISEKVNPLCFGEDGACDYEGSLWATLVLSAKKKNVSDYIPYLVAMSDETENLQYLPKSFLYTLTNNFKLDVLSKQMGSQYWDVSGDKFYDTAIALLPFQNQDIAEKTNSKTWLGEIQETDGCWGSTRNTALLLYSLWPRKNGDISSTKDCSAANYFCRSSLSCLDDGGVEMDDYDASCFGTDVCCSKEQQLESCAAQSGELCSSSEQCLGGTEVESTDSNSEKFCCVNGVCGQQQITQCETNNGICRTTCTSKEKLSPYTCNGSDICCVTKKFNWVLLIIILIILIILAVIGIIFRKQLRDIFFKVKAWVQSKFKFKGKKPSSPMTPPGRLPTTSSARIPAGAVQRRIIPQQQRAPVTRPVQKKSDFDDVLKKLREIGK
jgi:hypothetical protein